MKILYYIQIQHIIPIILKSGWVAGYNHANLSDPVDNIIRYDNIVDIFSEYTNSAPKKVI